MTQLKIVTPPAETVVSVTEAKDYLRIDNNVEDARLATMIKAATRKLEEYVGVKFVTQVWDVFMDRFPMQANGIWWEGQRDGAIGDVFSKAQNVVLPIGVAQSLDEFATYDDSGTEYPSTVGDFVFDDVSGRARVGLKVGGVWPQTILRANNGIRFRVTVGYGAAADVPSDIKEAVLEFVAHIYENRADQEEMKLPAHVLGMVDQYRRYKVGC